MGPAPWGGGAPYSSAWWCPVQPRSPDGSAAAQGSTPCGGLSSVCISTLELWKNRYAALVFAAEPLEACAISSPGYAKKAAASVNNRCLSRSSKKCTIENSSSVQWAWASGRALRHSETFGSVHSTCCQ